jgi:hypothetical protein
MSAKTNSSGIGFLMPIAVPMLLLLYVLSAGPVLTNFTIVTRHTDTAFKLYKPVLYLQRTPLRGVFLAYMHLWGWFEGRAYG